MRFESTELSADERALRREVREFLAAELPRGSFLPGLGMNSGKDPTFSKKLAERGWVGMALPKQYGGHDRSAVDRFIVVEELLRWGAPIDHHWVADRQSGVQIARFGTEAQKQRFLPGICRGELSFSIGMSEPDSGSDLASISTKATRAGGGWLVSGTKVWTTGAHRNDWAIVLCRTTPAEELDDKRAGLSQMIVDLQSRGLTVRPIPFIDNTFDFCEVMLDDVFVPDELVLGDAGAGWTQNMSELVFERGGPDRWLSTYLVVEDFLREHSDQLTDAALDLLGDAAAHFWVLHNLSLSVARAIDAGAVPAVQASLVKELGTRFEQDVLNAVRELVDLEPNLVWRSRFEYLLVTATLTAPSFTIRGGTNEILRSVAAKGLRDSTRGARVTAVDPLLVETVERLLEERCTFEVIEQAEADGWCPGVWESLDAAGFARVSLPEPAGGSGGSLGDALAVLRAIGAYAAPVPFAETAVLGGWLLAQAGLGLPTGPVGVVPDPAALRIVDGRLAGHSTVAWGRRAEIIAALVRRDDEWIVVQLTRGDIEVTPGANLAGEPRDRVQVDVALDAVGSAPAPPGLDSRALMLRGALTRVAMMAGAADTMSRLAVDYAHERRQFGQAIARFQAVQHHLVTLAQSAAQLSMAADVAGRQSGADVHEGAFEIAAAKIIADEAAALGTRAAHQVHGAMGVTREYPLHHFSRRLWAWQHEYGRAAEWRRRLGTEVAAAGADAMFATITR